MDHGAGLSKSLWCEYDRVPAHAHLLPGLSLTGSERSQDVLSENQSLAMQPLLFSGNRIFPVPRDQTAPPNASLVTGTRIEERDPRQARAPQRTALS